MLGKNQEGFTLLEVLIVAGIIAAVVTITMTRMDNRNTELRETVRELGVISRTIHNMARLKGQTYRLVLDMQVGEGSEFLHSYWVESSSKSTLISAEATVEEYKSPEEREIENKKNKGKKKSPEGFQPATDVLKKPVELGGGLIIEDVEILNADKAISSGRVYIHFLPQGYVEESAIHLSVDKNIHWTIAIHPLTGKADIIPKYVSLKDIRDQ